MRSQAWGSVCLLILGASVFWLASPSVHADDAGPTCIVDPSEARIQAALDKRLAWEFLDTPLSEASELMADALGIEILLDTKGLNDFGVDSGTPVTWDMSGISTRSFLRLMLNELELTYILRDSALWITTPEECESQLITCVYPIGDILHEISENCIPPLVRLCPKRKTS
ncbi:MAG: hypothetical protein CMJ64_18045 [Planctomycetaceae bacterium]|nr:hypothetical protein [Planctomycetaceae bacterium]